MRRDWDLIREMLILVEEENSMWPEGKNTDEYWTEQRLGHAELLCDAGLIEGLDWEPGLAGAPATFHYNPQPKLTWHGHDFLDAIRDETVWEKTKEHVGKAGGSITIGLLTNLATMYLAEKLGVSQ